MRSLGFKKATHLCGDVLDRDGRFHPIDDPAGNAGEKLTAAESFGILMSKHRFPRDLDEFLFAFVIGMGGDVANRHRIGNAAELFDREPMFDLSVSLLGHRANPGAPIVFETVHPMRDQVGHAEGSRWICGRGQMFEDEDVVIAVVSGPARLFAGMIISLAPSDPVSLTAHEFSRGHEFLNRAASVGFVNFDGVIFVMTPEAEGVGDDGTEKGAPDRLFFGDGVHCLVWFSSIMAKQEMRAQQKLS